MRRALDAALEGCEVIFHEAAIPSVARSLITPRLTNDVNVTGTIEVMLAAADMASDASCSPARPRSTGPGIAAVPRDAAPRAACSPVRRQQAGRGALHPIPSGLAFGVETVVLRYFNVFGPGQDPLSEYAAVVPRFTTAILEGRQPLVNGNGEISRDFTYVDNVVSANLLAASPRRPPGITCNVACGSRYTLLDLLDAICAAAGKRVEPTSGRRGPVTSSIRRRTSRSRAKRSATRSWSPSPRASRRPWAGTSRPWRRPRSPRTTRRTSPPSTGETTPDRLRSGRPAPGRRRTPDAGACRAFATGPVRGRLPRSVRLRRTTTHAPSQPAPGSGRSAPPRHRTDGLLRGCAVAPRRPPHSLRSRDAGHYDIIDAWLYPSDVITALSRP